MGSLVPFLAIYLKRGKGLNEGEIGLAIGIASFSILFTPVLMTLLADTRFDPRRLTSLIFLISGASLLGLHFAQGLLLVLLLLTIHSLAYAGVMPLHDGMTFSLQRQWEKKGRTPPPYNRIRFWGTIGFIIPSLFLFFLLDTGLCTGMILFSGLAYSILALINVFRVPDPRLVETSPKRRQQLPTALAARLMLRPHMRVFSIAMFLYLGASFSFTSFYPLYLADVIGIEERWVGLIYNFGVTLEIGFMLSLGWLHARLGFRKLMLLGISVFVLQTLALGFFPTPLVAVLGQSVHGIIILSMYIAPIMYLNRQAGDTFRNSIQGLYTMAIVGVSRIVGISVAGQVGQIDLRLTPFFAAAGATIALILFAFFFREPARFATKTG